MTEAITWFAACGLVIIMAGTLLTKSADTIADRSGLGRMWIGMVLLATATSLPELVTDIAAVRLGAFDLAAGDLFGSSMANMLILALVNIFPGRGEVFRRAAADHGLAGVHAIGLTALAAGLILLRPEATVFGVSPASCLILFVFLAGIYGIYRNGQVALSAAAVSRIMTSGDTPAAHQSGESLRHAVLRFGLAAAVILLVAPRFALAAKDIADLSGLGGTFVGTWLVAAATSAPELVTTVTAVRIGAFDLAVGNLFGSNAFNMIVLPAMDVAYPGGSIYTVLSADHVLSALVAISMMCLGIAAILSRKPMRYAKWESASLLMVLIYAGGLWLLYLRSAGQ